MAAKSKRPGLVQAKRTNAARAGVKEALERRDKAEASDEQAKKQAKRQKATFELPTALLAELRVASAVSGETLVTVVQQGLIDGLQRLRDEFMDGKPFLMQAKTRKGRPEEE